MANKDLERLHAVAAAKLLKETWILQDVPEPLDFLVNGTFGLEITTFNKDSSRKSSALRESESRRYSWLQSVCKSYYSLCQQSVFVEVRLGPAGMLPDVHSFAQHLANITNTRALKKVRLEYDNERGKGVIFYLSTLPASVGNYHRWTFVTNHVGLRATAAPEQIAKVIMSKSKKLHSYLKKVAEVDLLIVADATSNSGMISYDGPCPAGHGFRRILFMDYPASVHVLSPILPSVTDPSETTPSIHPSS